MTTTYAEITKQIEVLKRDAEKIRRKEITGVIARIRSAIAAYNLTAEDLGLVPAKRGAGDKAAKSTKSAAAPAKKTRAKRGSKPAAAPAEVKYRNETGGTWGGRGKRPQWLRDAIAAGKKLEEFAVQA